MKQTNIKILLTALFVYFVLPPDSARASFENPPGRKTPSAGDIQLLSPADRDMFYTFGTGSINDSIARRFKSLGVTSIESYVTWETCERDGEGQWDWSEWDKTVQVLKDNNLQWVPFLILGPAYSTPDWFRMSEDHYPCRCLEHGFDNQVESLWNPHLSKWIKRFLKAFAERYKDSGVIESVLLGIQGDFGEAIYSVTGGKWTYQIPGIYHNHEGFWCDDPYALADFNKFVRKRYYDVKQLNNAWGTEFKNFGDIDFPGRKEKFRAFYKLVHSGDPQARRRWIDFVDWYRAAMTDFSDWWMETTRNYFPNAPIYLCTGGNAIPPHGSNFAEQTRVAAKHDAGIRITNEASNYPENFSITRWVASAGKHYNTYYGFEPAGPENEKGIVARIYNATASGANQLHDYSSNVTRSQSRTNAQQEHIKYLYHVDEPIVPVALWYPDVTLTIGWEDQQDRQSKIYADLNYVVELGEYFQKAIKFRDYADFDYIDETMLRTGALSQNKILVIVHGKIMEPSDAEIIADWIRNGGQVIVMDVPGFESVEATPEPEQILFGKEEATRQAIGKGEIVRVNGWDGLAQALRGKMQKLSIPVCDLKQDSIFATQTGQKQWLFLNSTSKSRDIEINYPGSKHDATIEAATITEVDLED
jgi:hypothetical protein